MPRKPLTFSPFSRSLASAHRRRPSPKTHKKKIVPKSSSVLGKELMSDNTVDSESCSSGSSDEEEIVNGILQQEAVFSDPIPDDFDPVKNLLKTYLDVREWDLSGFVDLILSQTTVGTLVKFEGNEDNFVCALLTVLNLHRYKDQNCMVQIKEFLLRVCPENDVKGKLESLVSEESQNVALLVSHCMLHFPPLPPLYDGVFNEVSWATEDEPTEELRKSFFIKHYLMITRIEKLRKKSQRKRQRCNEDEEIIYYKPEDEIFHKLSLWSFTFPWQTQELAPHESKKYKLMGLVMVIESEKIPEFLRELHSSFDNV